MVDQRSKLHGHGPECGSSLCPSSVLSCSFSYQRHSKDVFFLHTSWQSAQAITSDELNFLIYRYLMESGRHSNAVCTVYRT